MQYDSGSFECTATDQTSCERLICEAFKARAMEAVSELNNNSFVPALAGMDDCLPESVAPHAGNEISTCCLRDLKMYRALEF